MIECKNLSVSLSSQSILNGFTSHFDNGTLTSIIGKNGCGKTTLLKTMSGFYKYDGEVTVDGKSLHNYKKSELSKAVSLMPQILTSPSVTVRRLIEYGRTPYTGLSGILSPSDHKTVENAIAECGINDISEKFVNCISGGEQRKAFFAMVMAQDTQNVLLDEPCANLDAEYKNKLIELISALKEKNKTVIAVFHDINVAIEHSDRLVFFDGGKCVFDGEPLSAIRERIPEKVFGLKRNEYTENGKIKYFYH